MRIGVIASPWVPVPPPAYGGSEVMIDILTRGLQEAGHDVLLYATGDSTCPVPRGHAIASPEGIEMGSLPYELQHVIAAYDAMQDCDIIHDHTLTGVIYSERFPDLNIVTTCHGEFNDAFTAIYRKAAEHASTVAISHSQASTAKDFPINRVIYHGLPVEEYPYGEGNGDYFLSLGRMSPVKGIAEAAMIAREAGVKLIIAAKMREAAERTYFEEEVKPLLNDDVRYIGEVGFNEKVALLGNARALLNPLRWLEPFGLTMIEAMACGTPVVAFPSGAATEIVDHGVTGYLCNSMEEMAGALSRVENLDRNLCRAAVKEKFSAERMVHEYIDLFTELLKR